LDRDPPRRHASAAAVVAHLLQQPIFAYPLKGTEALMKLGPIEAALCVASYAKARAFPNPSRGTSRSG